MTDRITTFRDTLGAADSYLHAIERMAESVFNRKGHDYCAMLLLVEAAKKEIATAQEVVDAMEGGE
jgi:hypothetical protein